MGKVLLGKEARLLRREGGFMITGNPPFRRR